MKAPADNVPPVLNPARQVKKTLRLLFLTLFLRGRSSRGIQRGGVPKSLGQKLSLTLLFYGLFGCLAWSFKTQTVFALAVYLHAMTFVFLGMFVASSAGEVLFNKEESDILLHRPVFPQDLLWAKVWVMVEVSLLIAGSFNLMGLFVGLQGEGGWLFPLAHVTSTIVEALFCTGCIVLVYQLCLHWFGRERLDGLMTTAQVGMAVLAVAGGQLVPRLLINSGGSLNLLSHQWWIVFLPPAWFAGFDDAIAGTRQSSSWILLGVGLLATLVVLWLAFGKLAGVYEAGLQTLGEAAAPARKRRVGKRWIERLLDLPPLRWWMRNSVERAAFLLASAYLLRDRDVKLRVYPAMGPMLVMPFVFLLQPGTSGDFGIAFLGGYLGLVPLMGINLLQYSQQWQASDIFRVAPMAGPASLCHGTRRAVLCLLTLPLMIGFAIIIGLLHKGNSHVAVVLPGLLALPIYALMPSLGGRCILLSTPTEESKSVGRGLSMFGAIMIAMVLSFASTQSWLHGWFWWLVGGEAAVVTVLYVLMRLNISRARWEPID